MTKARSLLIVAAIAVVSSAHVGSPDVFFDGDAGPYKLHIRVAPPNVVPGVAWIFVRTAESDIQRITVRPVFWRAGLTGAPPGDSLTPVPGERELYAGKLWLMSRGAYSVYVDVAGARGRHTAIVPVMAMATARLGLSNSLTAILVVLGLLLFAGLVAIVRAAASDSLVDPGEVPDQGARRRGSLGAIIALPVLAVALFGGANWWKSEDSAYQRTMYRPLVATAAVSKGPRSNSLRFAILDTGPQQLISAPLMADHGKMMHLFLVKESSMSAFAHLHPIRANGSVFVSVIPAIPPGRYFAFADIALETGAAYTVTTTVDIPPPVGDTTSDPDDSWIADAFGVPAKPGALATLNKTADLRWDGPDSIVAGRDVALAFSVRNRKGAVIPVEPYLGMVAHAIVIRDDASVFIHLHPMGTVTIASQEAFAQRDRGDTAENGRLRPQREMAMPVPVTVNGTFSFPYAFPRPGRYRLWVQVKLGKRVETADYEVNAH